MQPFFSQGGVMSIRLPYFSSVIAQTFDALCAAM
jgi:hypothetical protein